MVEYVCANHETLFPDHLSSLCDEGTTEEIYDVVGLAVAAFEDSPEVNAFSSKYDAYLAALVKLTKEERKGLSLVPWEGQVREVTRARFRTRQEPGPLYGFHLR